MECITQIIDIGEISCPAARKVIIQSRILDHSCKLVQVLDFSTTKENFSGFRVFRGGWGRFLGSMICVITRPIVDIA